MTRMPKPYVTRLQKEYKQMMKNPAPHIVAAPLPSNLLEWHYCIYDLSDCPYAGGFYHGKLVFPEEYPYKPPSIYMITPNGRFQSNTRLCLSMSDFHPDTWNPAWSVESILKGLLSFMLENTPTSGSVSTTTAMKQRLAAESGAVNLKNARFCELFPDMVERIREDIRQRRAAGSDAAISATGNVGHDLGAGSGHSTLSNVVVVGVVAVFCYIVALIIRNQD